MVQTQRQTLSPPLLIADLCPALSTRPVPSAPAPRVCVPTCKVELRAFLPERKVCRAYDRNRSIAVCLVDLQPFYLIFFFFFPGLGPTHIRGILRGFVCVCVGRGGWLLIFLPLQGPRQSGRPPCPRRTMVTENAGENTNDPIEPAVSAGASGQTMALCVWFLLRAGSPWCVAHR